MFKKLLFAFILIISLVAVDAAVEGDISVDYFRLYEDGVRIVDLDGWGGYNTFIVTRGTTIEVGISLINPYSESVDISFEGTLYDIDDGNNIKRKNDATIGGDDRGSMVFEYYIPVDTPKGKYDYVFIYSYTIYDNYTGDNGTVVEDNTYYKHAKDFEFQVKDEQADINNILINLTEKVVELGDENNRLLTTVFNLSEENAKLGLCKAKLGGLEQLNKTNSEYKEKYFEETNKSISYMEKYNECNGQKGSMYSLTQLEDKVFQGKRQQKREDDNMLLMVIAGGGIWIYFQRKKKSVGGEGEGNPLTGTWT